MQDTYLSGVNISVTAFQSTNPHAMGAVPLSRPQSSMTYKEHAKRQGRSRKAGGSRSSSPRTHGIKATPLVQRDFASPPRPHTAAPVSRSKSPGGASAASTASHNFGATWQHTWAMQPVWGPGASAASHAPSPLMTSEFMKRLSPDEQKTLVARLARRRAPWDKPVTLARPAAMAGGRTLGRQMSNWEKPPEVPVKARDNFKTEQRKTGRYYSAMASKTYRTETGKLIAPQEMEEYSRKLALPLGAR